MSQFTVKLEKQHLATLSVIENLKTLGCFVDVSLVCEGHTVKAHKLVLAAGSPFFRQLFLENPCQHPIIIMQDVSYTILKEVIRFLYTGELSVSSQSLKALLKTVKTFKVKILIDLCNEGLHTSSSSDSVLFLEYDPIEITHLQQEPLQSITTPSSQCVSADRSVSSISELMTNQLPVKTEPMSPEANSEFFPQCANKSDSRTTNKRNVEQNAVKQSFTESVACENDSHAMTEESAVSNQATVTSEISFLSQNQTTKACPVLLPSDDIDGSAFLDMNLKDLGAKLKARKVLQIISKPGPSVSKSSNNIEPLLSSICEAMENSPSTSTQHTIVESSIPSTSTSDAILPYSSPDVIDVKRMLESTTKGVQLLKLFANSQLVINRKDVCQLNRICVGSMIADLKTLYPTTQQKINLAQAIIRTIPALKSKRENVEGYETFYDPVKTTGMIEFRLKTLRVPLAPSEKKNKRKMVQLKETIEVLEDVNEEDMSDKILWLQYQLPSEHLKTEIFKTMEETFPVRRAFIANENPSISEVLNKYPKLLEYKGALIDAEFKKMLPEAGSFEHFLKFYTPRILLYVNKSRMDLAERHAMIPNENFQALRMLADLMPVTGFKGRRETMDSEKTWSDAIVKFLEANASITEEIKKSPERHPWLLGIGNETYEDNQYFLVLDNKVVDCGSCILKAFDYLYKSHYVFNVKCSTQLLLFYNFMDFMVYKVKKGPARSAVEMLHTLIAGINP